MKKLILFVISGLFLIGCGENSERERIDQRELDIMIKRQRAEAAANRIEPMNVEFSRSEVSSKRGGFAMAQNSSGELLTVGDKGIFLNGEEIEDIEVAKQGGEVAAAINENGDFIAVGNKSVYVKMSSQTEGEVIEDLRVGSDMSYFSADINEDGSWIVVGNHNIIVNGKIIKSEDIPVNTTRFEAFIDEDLNWKVYTNEGLVTGDLTTDEDETEQSSVDESLLQ